MPAILDRALESLRGGDTASFTRDLTEDDIRAFAQLSGDRNPLHTDDGYAASTQYGRRVAHGQLVAAPISALAGHLLPGKRCVLLEVRARFVRPVFPGDRLTYRGTVAHVSAGTRTIDVDVEVANHDGAIVLAGRYRGQVLAATASEGASA